MIQSSSLNIIYLKYTKIFLFINVIYLMFINIIKYVSVKLLVANKFIESDYLGYLFENSHSKTVNLLTENS